MAVTYQKTSSIETELSRDLGFTSAMAIGVGTMIAAGIFTLSGLAIRNVGSAAILSFFLAAIVASFTALTYCEFVSIYPQSGEGYLYSRKTFKPPLAYLTGWALILGYTSSCALYIASLSRYFYEFIWRTPFESMAGIAGLVILVILNIKGTKESGSFQVVVTIAKVCLLLWFIAGGIGTVKPQEIINRFSTDFLKIGSTAGLVFITFFGFSAIAATAGEIRNPVKNIPRSIFISMGLVTVLYTLVILVIIAAGLHDYTEAAMGEAASIFLGPIGGLVIVAGAIFSMISASNASIMAASRVSLSMSRLSHLPERVGFINPRTRTPIVALTLTGIMILIFSLGFRLEDLAHFADTVLLLVLIIVNFALIVHRRKYPNLERPFRVPLVPVLPMLAIIANLYLLSQILHHWFPVVIAGFCLLLGIFGFMAWKGIQPQEEALPGTPSRVALELPAKEKGLFRILVPIANPANAKQLIDLACSVAVDKKGEIVALRVASIPEQVSPAHEDRYIEQEKGILDIARRTASDYGTPITSLIRIGHDVARAILESARERECNLIIMGWKGHTSTARKIFGETSDAVVNHSRSDIMLVKIEGEGSFKRLLLPTAGGEHAVAAERYATSIAKHFKGSITLCGVVPPNAAETTIENTFERLEQAKHRISSYDGIDIDSKIVYNTSVSDGILQESDNYDAVLVGAAGKSIYPEILFGSIPETIVKKSTKSVIVVKHHHRIKALLGRVMEE